MAAKRKKSGLNTAVNVIYVIFAMILVLLIVVGAWAGAKLNLISRETGAKETLSDAQIQSIQENTDVIGKEYPGLIVEENVELSEDDAGLIENSDTILNILLIGQDRRENQGRQRSDSMILCTIDLDRKKLVLTSFLRDLYVEIPDWNGKCFMNNRLNVCYVLGGMEMLDECLRQNFGVSVDQNIEVDFSGFEKIVDQMGGVDIDLTDSEAKWMGGGLHAGVNTLDGKQALEYARIRKLDSDFGRTNRQRTVLLALLEKVKSMSLTELNTLIDALLPLITTDMSNGEIVRYAARILPILSQLQVTTQSIPASGTYTNASIRGMAVLVPDMESNRQILRDTLG